MSTTTIRLDDDLKARIATAASHAGKTSHAFILDAIARTVQQAEEDAAFRHLAETRWSAILETGETVAWGAAKTWLEARAREPHPPRPKAG